MVGWGEVWDCGWESISRYAGFNLLIDTVSLRPLMFNLKILSVLSSTGYGSSYRDCKGLRTASCLTNTCVAVASA